ncbi:MAG: acyl-ACP thioesterase [Deltaproteobacteria bacterium]|jgi:acyl-ACP thioesterase|nr:acyl-ACP thioesterase [Deltaproteobacteria bacterium]
MLPSAAHTEEFTVRSYDLDWNRRLRLQTLCGYLEESAGLHADVLGVGLERLMAEGRTWVLLRLRLRLVLPLDCGRRVRVKTWPVEREGLHFRRDFLLEDESGRILVRAVSHWAVLGLASRRLEPVPEYIAVLKPENPPRALEDGAIRIPAPSGATEGPSFPVRLSDIDLNRHVNNSRYLDFILEAADAFGRKTGLAGLDLIFRAEGLPGDVIGSRTAPGEDGRTLLHSLQRLSDGRELVRASSVWNSPQ